MNSCDSCCIFRDIRYFLIGQRFMNNNGHIYCYFFVIILLRSVEVYFEYITNRHKSFNWCYWILFILLYFFCLHTCKCFVALRYLLLITGATMVSVWRTCIIWRNLSLLMVSSYSMIFICYCLALEFFSALS